MEQDSGAGAYVEGDFEYFRSRSFKVHDAGGASQNCGHPARQAVAILYRLTHNQQCRFLARSPNVAQESVDAQVRPYSSCMVGGVYKPSVHGNWTSVAMDGQPESIDNLHASCMHAEDVFQ